MLNSHIKESTEKSILTFREILRIYLLLDAKKWNNFMELLLTFLLAKLRITLVPLNSFNERFIKTIHLDRKSPQSEKHWQIITIASTYISFTLSFLKYTLVHVTKQWKFFNKWPSWVVDSNRLTFKLVGFKIIWRNIAV